MRLFVLACGMFAVGVDGFVIAGILNPIATDLQVSVPTAGQLEVSFALAIAILGPLVVTALGAVRPRVALTSSLVLFALFNVLAAVAPSFWVLMVARILAAVSVSVFAATSPAAAVMTARDGAQGKALAYVTAGMTAGIVLGVPIGILLTVQMSWRWSFVLVAVLGILAAAGCATQFADLPAPPRTTMRDRASVVAKPAVAQMLLSLTVWMLGGYVLYVYMGPMLENVAGFSAGSLPWIFFAFGVASIVGNLLGGVLLDRIGPKVTLVVGLSGGGLGLLLTSLWGTSQVGVLIAVILWSTAGWMLMPPQQSRLLAVAPERAPVLMSVNASALYLGMGLGGVAGGIVQAEGGLRSLGWVGALVELVAIILVVTQRRSGGGGAAERDEVEATAEGGRTA